MPLRHSVLRVLPWGAALWSAVSGGVVVLRRDDLDAPATTAFALDAVGSALAVRPLSQRRPSGWWLMFGPIVAQPVFAAVDLRHDPSGLPKAAGRTLGAAVGAVGLLALRRDFGTGQS